MTELASITNNQIALHSEAGGQGSMAAVKIVIDRLGRATTVHEMIPKLKSDPPSTQGAESVSSLRVHSSRAVALEADIQMPWKQNASLHHRKAVSSPSGHFQLVYLDAPRKYVLAMDNEENFYVYLFRDPVTGEPVYVGKGQGSRAISHTWAKARTNDRLGKLIAARSAQSLSMEPEVIANVRRLVFWNQWALKLRESLAHLFGLIMRRAGGDASVALRVSSV